MDFPPPEWLMTAGYDELQYAGLPLARIYHQPDGTVQVRTRCYSEGFTPTREMATATGGRRYIEAWLRKWGADAMRDARNKAMSLRIESERIAAMPKAEVRPDPRKPRRGRKPF